MNSCKNYDWTKRNDHTGDNSLIFSKKIHTIEYCPVSKRRNGIDQKIRLRTIHRAYRLYSSKLIHPIE